MRFRKRLFTLLALLSILWIMGGFLLSSDAYNETTAGSTSEAYNAGAAIGAGALGSVLSGSGSTILAVTERDPEGVGRAMAAVWEADGVHCQVVTSDIDLEGASIIE